MKLFNYEYDADTIIVGVLHDILEDASYTTAMLIMNYGETISDIVSAVTFNKSMKDKHEQNIV